MKNKNLPFLEFLSSREVPPKALAQSMKKEITLSFQGRSIILRFAFFQILGALFSLTVCPQFGIGLPEGHGISHAFRMIGDWACAAFCGSLFLASGAIIAWIGMKGEELWWIWRRYKYSLVIFPAALWASLMLGNLSMQLPPETLVYHGVWLLTAVAIQYLWLQFRSKLFVWNEFQEA
jgi:hypothetical protein